MQLDLVFVVFVSNKCFRIKMGVLDQQSTNMNSTICDQLFKYLNYLKSDFCNYKNITLASIDVVFDFENFSLTDWDKPVD